MTKYILDFVNYMYLDLNSLVVSSCPYDFNYVDMQHNYVNVQHDYVTCDLNYVAY